MPTEKPKKKKRGSTKQQKAPEPVVTDEIPGSDSDFLNQYIKAIYRQKATTADINQRVSYFNTE